MTKREGAVLSAFTGNLLCKLSDMHEYIEEIMERPVFTHELANKELVEQIKEKAKPEAIKIIESQS